MLNIKVRYVFGVYLTMNMKYFFENNLGGCSGDKYLACLDIEAI